MSIRFCPIASGSSGNSIYIGTDSANILIDAGLSGKSVENGLRSIGVQPSELDAIFVTHEHSDHIQGVGVLSRRFGVPVYATERTWQQMERHNMIGQIAGSRKHVVRPGERCRVKDVSVNPFEIPHDCAAPVGYSVYAGSRKISVATDIGHVTDGIKYNIAGSDALLLECNHDVEMLQKGRYPYHLKKRVMGPLGHLSNESAGKLLADIMSDNLKYVFLGHLSAENNLPLLALDTVSGVLSASGINTGQDVRLFLAHRECVSEMVQL